MLIKICGVQDPETALFAAQNGADFIGMIVTSGFRRSVTIPQAQEIVKAARKGGAELVAVFVGVSAEVIELTCRHLDIHFVQAYQLDTPLAPHLKRFYINEPNALLRPHCDFLLMEGNTPGSGEAVDRSHYKPMQQPCFLAGGLNCQNVKEISESYRPHGVDVSSGVEEDYKKTCSLILKFIKEVKRCE